MTRSTEFVTYTPEGRVSISVDSPTEARSAIKSLKLKKREMVAAKKAVASEMKHLRGDHQSRIAQRGSKTRGRGLVARLSRAMQTSERDGDRRAVDDRVQPLRHRIEKLDKGIGQIDDAIRQLEEYVLDPTPGSRTSESTPTLAPKPEIRDAIKSKSKVPTIAIALLALGIFGYLTGNRSKSGYKTRQESNPTTTSENVVAIPVKSESSLQPQSTLFVDGHLQVLTFAKTVHSREDAQRLLGDDECGKYYRPSGPGDTGGSSCTYLKSNGEKVSVLYAYRNGGLMPVSVSILDVNHLPFGNGSLLPFGVKSEKPTNQNDTTLEWSLPTPLLGATVYRYVNGEVYEVKFSLAP